MDDEARARIEALELVAVDLLAARFGRQDLDDLLAGGERCLALRDRVSALPGWAFGDAAWRWRQRLLHLARRLAERD